MTEGQYQISLYFIVNSGVTHAVTMCQTPLPNGQNLALLAGDECPAFEQKRPFVSLCGDLWVPDRGQVIGIYTSHRPFGPVTMVNYITQQRRFMHRQDARALGSACPKSKFADRSNEAASGHVTCLGSTAGILLGTAWDGIRTSLGCPEAFPLSKTKQRTRSCSVAGWHLYHLICPSYYVKIIKVTLLFYFKLNFSKLPSFSTNIAYADRSVLSFCSLCLHCPFHSLVSGDLRWMGVVGAQSCMSTEEAWDLIRLS